MSESVEPTSDIVQLEDGNEQLEEEQAVDAPKPQATKQPDDESQQEKKKEQQLHEDEKEKLGQEQQKEKKNQNVVLKETQESMKLDVNSLLSRGIKDEKTPLMDNVSSPKKDELENLKNKEEKNFIDVNPNSIKSIRSSRKEEDNDSDSVCVIDDDEDDDGDGEIDGDGSSFDEDDESSSYHDDDDSEETDRDHYNDDHDRRKERNVRRNEDEGEEEEEEVEELEELEEAEYDSEADGFDGGSDDLVLRHSNGLTKCHKERSASLQDLNVIKEGLLKNKNNVNPYSQKARFERNQSYKERRTPGKQYSHIESKVKKYIIDMTQQRRLFGERRKKAQEEAKRNSLEATETRRNDDVALTCKTIKNYTEKTLKEVAEYEESDNDEMYIMPQNLENGEIRIFRRHSMDNNQRLLHHQEIEVDPTSIDSHNKDEKIDKINGSVLNDNQNYTLEKKGILRCDEYSIKPVLNGEETSDFDNLSYNEYMKSNDHEEVINDHGSVEVMHNASEKCNMDDTESACIIQIANVTSNYNTEKISNTYQNLKIPIKFVNQATETYQENYEINALRSQLEQRNSQFDHLRDAYQKTMSENMTMKLELDNLKKMLAYYQEQQKVVPETRAAAVQTEETPILTSKYTMIECNSVEEKTDPRLITNSMISTVSSQWSDSTESAATSMEPPPNVTNVLNSDDSIQQLKTPLKQKKAFSRAFITSSRILQTLSNITHGKSKSDRYGCKFSNTMPESSTELNAKAENKNTQPVEIRSRKRKATDSAELSSSAHPFKIPHTSKTNWETRNKRENSPLGQSINSNESNLSNSETDGQDNECNNITENVDDVKVFVYPEDDEGKEHSFLIQAKEVATNSNVGVRECGPYLLGNVEVYMTEMNGTINIWGKELNQNTTTLNDEELETSTRAKASKSNFRWQSTPRIFNHKITASTSKKSRIIPRFTQQRSKRHFYEINNTIVDCESCNSHNHRLSWPSCNESLHQENQNSCCSPSVRIEQISCRCAQKVEKKNVAVPTCCNSSKFIDARRYSLPNIYPDNNYECCYKNHHTYCKNTIQRESCRHQQFIRRHSFNATDEENESDTEENALTSKSCHSFQENLPQSCIDAKLVTPCLNNGKRNRVSCTEPSVCQNENDPLIFQRQNPDAPEVRKRRLNGRKVRGLLMDLLKGCGDCRTANPINKSSLHHNTSVYEPSTSAQHKVACLKNQETCTPRSNEKCSLCHSRSDKTAEIETQLEFFRIEMDKLRSRSDTLSEMLDTLRNTDIIN